MSETSAAGNRLWDHGPDPAAPGAGPWPAGMAWEEVRRLWPQQMVRDLNFGAYGRPTAAITQARAELEEELNLDPTGFFRQTLPQQLGVARERAAALLGARPGHLALVRNSTTGTAAVAQSLRLRPGDEILTTSQSFGTVRHAMGRAAEAAGARVVEVEVPVTANTGRIVAALEAAITPATRLLAIDAISSPLGMVFPVEEIVAMAHSHPGLEVFVDAAHAPGNLVMDLERTGADYTVVDFHKWLLAPRGAAALHVRGDTTTIRSAIAGAGATAGFPRALEVTGIDDHAGALLLPTALDTVESIGPDRMRRHNIALAAVGAAAVTAELRTTPLECRFAGFASALLPPGVAADASAAAALQRDIRTDLNTSVTVAPVAGRGIVRLSGAPFVTVEQMRAFATELGPYVRSRGEGSGLG